MASTGSGKLAAAVLSLVKHWNALTANNNLAWLRNASALRTCS